VGLPLYLLHAALWPVHALFDRVIEPIVRRVSGGGETDFHSAEEVMRMARMARSEPGNGTPLAIIGATAGAAEMTVSEIMVPRTEIVAFPMETAPDELLEKVLDERYTRVPIYEGSIDSILGIVHLKDLIKLASQGDSGGNGNGGGLASILKPVLRVPERKAILPLLEDMQRSFCHVAMVKDEFSVTMGMVTQEDILEEIVGEIRDEFDREELLAIRHLPDESFQALGRVKVLDFNRESGWEVPAEPGDTLSGLVFNALGRAPRKGDSVRVPGYELSVADVSGTRIARVRIRQLESDESDAEANA
jgi:CBS domain containing-hemolysin-like protein